MIFDVTTITYEKYQMSFKQVSGHHVLQTAADVKYEEWFVLEAMEDVFATRPVELRSLNLKEVVAELVHRHGISVTGEKWVNTI